MLKRTKWKLVIVLLVILAGNYVLGLGVDRIVTVTAENAPLLNRHIVIIDAGHGGEDGGAVSCTGIPESKLNLEIALKLKDLLALLGFDTMMIRTTDRSVSTEGETIAARKASDLKTRVSMVNETDNCVLVSIHQNYFTDSKYSGAQVFYANTPGSRQLAESLQSAFVATVNVGSNREVKPADGVYLMQHVTCPAVLVECGFISNYEEESRLQTKAYQQKICSVIAGCVSQYINNQMMA